MQEGGERLENWLSCACACGRVTREGDRMEIRKRRSKEKEKRGRSPFLTSGVTIPNCLGIVGSRKKQLTLQTLATGAVQVVK